MRLFIAIDCEELKPDFEEMQKAIDSVISKDVNSFHLTLKFLGKVSEDRVQEIINILKKVKFESFSFNLDKIGFFPNDNFIRVVWLGINPEQEVIELQKRINDLLKKDFKDDFDFKPHITLARVAKINDRDKFFESINKIKINKEKSVKVNNFKLIKSTLTPNGPIYEDIEVFKCSQE